jgi:cytoskeleton protein RodZ
MPEIGDSLRDARQQRKVDLFEAETHTKIRAKYLRALEEEEWDLLPGPTYVKTFLRTYAEFLGLDAKLLVEEYKQRFERPTPQELTPFSTNLGSRRERRRASGPVISPGVVVGVCFLLLVGALAALGILWPDNSGDGPTTRATPAATPKASATPRPARRRKAAPATVRLQIRPTAAVYVCLVSRAGKRLIPGQNLAAGENPTFRGSRFRVTLGNGNVTLRYGTRSFDVPDSVPAGGVGYEIRPTGRPRRLSGARRPSCA